MIIRPANKITKQLVENLRISIRLAQSMFEMHMLIDSATLISERSDTVPKLLKLSAAAAAAANNTMIKGAAELRWVYEYLCKYWQ